MTKFNPSVHDTVNPDETTLDAGGYVGVDPIYQNAANETDAPLGKEYTKSKAEEKKAEAEEKEESKTPAAPKAPAK